MILQKKEKMTIIKGFNFPDELYYHVKRHMWVKVKDDGSVKVGLTDSGQQIIGKISFLRVKPAGFQVVFEKSFGTVESAKWVGPIVAPINGEIIEINPEVKAKPSLINKAPYTDGWIVRIKPSNLKADLAKLLNGKKAIDAFKAELAKKKLKKAQTIITEAT